MKNALIICLALLFLRCSTNSLEKKGFQVSEITEEADGKKVVGLPIDSLKLETRPRDVLLTKHADHRLIPIYKVNYNERTGESFTGSNNFHTRWYDDTDEGNNWNYNLMPGLSAVYGYNLINIAHYDTKTETLNKFFNDPVLIKTLYYPSFSDDTLNYEPVKRDYYMVSVYDADTNQDGFINVKDLRHFYLFDIDGIYKKELIPKNYATLSSQYDSDNDFMYVFARLDKNQNGQMEQEEPMHVFWVDLKNPENNGMLYKD